MSVEFVKAVQSSSRETFAKDKAARGLTGYSQKAVVRPEDMAGRVVLLHADLDVALKKSVVEDAPVDDEGEWVFDKKATKKVTGVVKFLKKICKDKENLPKSIVIVTKLSDPPVDPTAVVVGEVEGGAEAVGEDESQVQSSYFEASSGPSTNVIAAKVTSMLADIVKKEGAEKVAVTWSRTCAELAANIDSVKGAVVTVPMRKIPEEGEEEEEYDSEVSIVRRAER